MYYIIFTSCYQSNYNHCSEFFFPSAYNERSLDDRCYRYWEKYCKRLAISSDERLIVEQSLINDYSTVVSFDKNEYLCFAEYSETF